MKFTNLSANPLGQQVCEVSTVFSDLYLVGSGPQFRCVPPPKGGQPLAQGSQTLAINEKVAFLKNGWPPQ